MGRASAVNLLDIARCYATMKKGAQAKKYLDECLASIDEGREIEQLRRTAIVQQHRSELARKLFTLNQY
ncbi:hypothetical protein T265_02169 [Opisthorchis viverrini]|uniref:Tetratricopeptide repeat protein n=1 Tax=Opisthorchis viverrini TaxID=6198 RepID=A0A075AIH9_OPIVI|nr:hypothetical protein T265_02169 [Opisthorchis viverrini]KER31664.1 hypothetical protein T265_02169 [Opisthorchis viverrini]